MFVRGVRVALEYVLDADARVRLPLRLVERVVGAQCLHLGLAPLGLHRPTSDFQGLPHFLAHRQLSAQHRRTVCSTEKRVSITRPVFRGMGGGQGYLPGRQISGSFRGRENRIVLFVHISFL